MVIRDVLATLTVTLFIKAGMMKPVVTIVNALTPGVPAAPGAPSLPGAPGMLTGGTVAHGLQQSFTFMTEAFLFPFVLTLVLAETPRKQ